MRFFIAIQVRSPNDSITVGHACHKWPLTVACGYGKDLPTNRFLMEQRSQGGTVGSTYCDGGKNVALVHAFNILPYILPQYWPLSTCEILHYLKDIVPL